MLGSFWFALIALGVLVAVMAWAETQSKRATRKLMVKAAIVKIIGIALTAIIAILATHALVERVHAQIKRNRTARWVLHVNAGLFCGHVGVRVGRAASCNFAFRAMVIWSSTTIRSNLLTMVGSSPSPMPSSLYFT